MNINELLNGRPMIFSVNFTIFFLFFHYSQNIKLLFFKYLKVLIC